VHNFNYTPTTLEYKVGEKLHLGVRKQKMSNTTVLVIGLQMAVLLSDLRASRALHSPTFLLQAECTQGHSRAGLGNVNNLITSSGIEARTIQLVT
jgi:hypothetical protein